VKWFTLRRDYPIFMSTQVGGAHCRSRVAEIGLARNEAATFGYPRQAPC
jgi:hypothetical protein